MKLFLRFICILVYAWRNSILWLTRTWLVVAEKGKWANCGGGVVVVVVVIIAACPIFIYNEQ